MKWLHVSTSPDGPRDAWVSMQHIVSFIQGGARHVITTVDGDRFYSSDPPPEVLYD